MELMDISRKDDTHHLPIFRHASESADILINIIFFYTRIRQLCYAIISDEGLKESQ